MFFRFLQHNIFALYQGLYTLVYLVFISPKSASFCKFRKLYAVSFGVCDFKVLFYHNLFALQPLILVSFILQVLKVTCLLKDIHFVKNEHQNQNKFTFFLVNSIIFFQMLFILLLFLMIFSEKRYNKETMHEVGKRN